MHFANLASFSVLMSCSFLATLAAQNASQSGRAAVPGTWTATPLVEFTKPDPETGGTFRTLGDAWLLSDGSTVFWAKYGEKDKGGWALYSVKDGPPKVVLKADEEFTAPDGIKKRYRLFDFGSTAGTNDLWVGRHAAFVALRPGINQESVYGVVAGSLVRLLGRGDTLGIGGPPAMLKRVTIDGLNHAGFAVLHYWTEKPAEREGWLLHDGHTLTALWTKGAAVPGDTTAGRIEGLVAGPHRFGDTTLVVFDTKPNRGQSVLYRLIPGQTERLLVSETPSPVEPGKKLRWPDEIRPASGDRFLLGVGADEFVINRTQGFFAWQNDFKPRSFPTQWLEYRSGGWRQVMIVGREPPVPKDMFGPLADSIGYLRAGGDSILIAGSYFSVGPRPMYGGGPQVIKRVPGFWLYDGATLKQMELPGAKIDLVAMADQASKRSQMLNAFGAHALPGATGVAVAELPFLFGGVRLFGAGQAAFAEPARFTLAGATWPVSEADIVGWVDERTAVVRRQALGVVIGYYSLVRQ